MKKFYHLEYQETEQTFADMFQVYFDDRSYYFYKLIVTIAGFLALFIKISMKTTILSVMFFTKFLLFWALGYVVGYLVVKYVISGINAKKAIRTGEEKYKLRVEKCGADLKIELDFQADNFTVTFQDKKVEYSYKEVSRMPASDKYYGFVVGGVYGNKEMMGFPADCLDPSDKEAFENDMAEKCQNVAGGFKKR